MYFARLYFFALAGRAFGIGQAVGGGEHGTRPCGRIGRRADLTCARPNGCVALIPNRRQNPPAHRANGLDAFLSLKQVPLGGTLSLQQFTLAVNHV